MSDNPCESIVDLLIDYADGELSVSESEQVRLHLADCPGCRAELGLLERSLDLARSLWSESANQAGSPPALSPASARRRPRVAMVLVACAAAILLVIGTRLIWRGQPNDVKDPLRPGDSIADNHRPDVVQPDEKPDREEAIQPDEEPDVEAIIARAERRARLAASAEFLATQPELNKYREEADRYLTAVFGDRSGKEEPNDPHLQSRSNES